MKAAELDEEARGLLSQIVERLGYRQLMAANIRGHGLKFLPDPGDKRGLVRDLEHSLETLERVEDLYRELGGENLALAVRGRMERIPYPGSRMELAVCLVVTDLAERLAMESFTGSVCDEVVEIASSVLDHERSATHGGEELFVHFCAERTQRPHAQQMFGRWVTIALLSLGRPGSPRDRRAVELGLRTRGSAETIESYLEGLRPFLAACDLELPDFAGTGVELPG